MFEHTIVAVGSGSDYDWQKAQQETLEDKQAQGWELVTVVLLNRTVVTYWLFPPKEHFHVAMYFKRVK